MGVTQRRRDELLIVMVIATVVHLHCFRNFNASLLSSKDAGDMNLNNHIVAVTMAL